MFDLDRPECVDDEQWQALTEHRERIDRAVRHGDLSLVIGSSKELCETCAKLVWVFSGQQFGSNTDMGELLINAHRAVDRLPGRGTAANDGVRDVSMAMRKSSRMAKRMSPLVAK
jgi:hypothetical protein